MYKALLNGNNICIGLCSSLSDDNIQGVLVDRNVIGMKYENGQWVKQPKSVPEPTQLDRIEQALNTSNEELRQEGADALILELIERGVL